MLVSILDFQENHKDKWFKYFNFNYIQSKEISPELCSLFSFY